MAYLNLSHTFWSKPRTLRPKALICFGSLHFKIWFRISSSPNSWALLAIIYCSVRIEVLHPPLAEAVFCQLAVLGWLMAPEQAQLPLPPGGKLLLEPLAGVLGPALRLPCLHQEVAVRQHLNPVLVLPPALPGHRLGKESAVFRPLLRGEGVQPIAKSVSIAKSVYVILPIAHAPANGVSLDLPVSQPRGRHDFLIL